MAHTAEKLFVIFADLYAVYLKTQSYHWHVQGPEFKALHQLFEEQYRDLAEEVDILAERIRTIGEIVPASFEDFNTLKTVSNPNAQLSSDAMVGELHHDHGILIEGFKDALNGSQQANDEGTVALLSEFIAKHEKTRWMLGASRKNQ